MTRKRRLRPDEAELWERVIASANRLRPEFPAPKPAPAEPPRARQPMTRPPLTLPPSPPPGKGSVSIDIAPSISDSLAAQPVQMDRKAFRRLRQGKQKPEARIDLHGMTQDQAHRALTSFILMQQQIGHRLVLVITGKGGTGRGNPGQAGILRRQVPHWLGLPPLKAAVLQIVEAHQSHGGSGALYVYLRRGR